MTAVVNRSPEMIVAGVTGVIGLRAALWLTTSSDTAYFIVVWLLPVWLLVEVLLTVGTLLCAYGLATNKPILLFGQRVQRQLSIPLCLVGVVTIVIESLLWLYGVETSFLSIR